MKLHLILSMCRAVAVVTTAGQETETEDQDDGRDDDRTNADRACSLFAGCKEFVKDPFKIKEKIGNVIGIKKTIKNIVGTEIKHIRDQVFRKVEKINKIKQFAGNVLDTKGFLVRQIPSVFNFFQGLVPTTPAPTPSRQQQGRPRFRSRFRFSQG